MTTTPPPHGTIARHKSRTHPCDCQRCTTASREYDNNRRRQIAYGRWQPYTDAAPARAHVLHLMRQGMGRKRIAHAAGVADSALAVLLYGRGNRPPTRRMEPRVAERVLAVELDLSDGRQIPIVGTLRRVHALTAIGWSFSEQARRVGVTSAAYRLRLRGHAITVAAARDVAVLYEQLCGTPNTAAGSLRARRFAEAHSWPPPQDWVNVDIDDPAAQPQPPAPEPDWEVVERVLAGKPYALDGTPLVVLPADRDEVVRRLILQGRPGAAARLLNVSGHTAKALVEQVVRGACLTEPAESEAS